MTLFETSRPAESEVGRPRADVVVRTPAPSARGGTFLSVVVVADGAAAEVERDLAVLDAAVARAYPVHEVVLVLSGSRGRLAWARALAER